MKLALYGRYSEVTAVNAPCRHLCVKHGLIGLFLIVYPFLLLRLAVVQVVLLLPVTVIKESQLQVFKTKSIEFDII